MTRPAVFLDRDGTLIEERGNLRSPDQVAFFPQTVDALRRLSDRFLLFIVTNQAGVSEGAITLDEATRVNDHVVRTLAQAGVAIRDVYCCPHVRADGCDCIKPKPHFMRQAERDHGVDLARSFTIGDHPCDVELATNVGARGLLVLSGHGAQHRAEVSVPCEFVPGISEGIDWIARTHAADLLRAGGLVAFPTETVYGLGADASNAAAVKRIFEVKGRPQTHPLIVHIADAGDLTKWAAEVPPLAMRLAEHFWPGPLTIILRRSRGVLDAVTGGQDTVGLRVPSHPMALDLLRAFGGGIAAPSANRFGRVSPTTAAHVREDLGDDVDFILDGGACAVGVESTIVDLSEAPAILRPGGVPRESIEKVIGRIDVRHGGNIRAPGQLESHYAPRAEVVLVEPGEMAFKAQEFRHRRVTQLAFDGEVEDVARRLYAALREVDREGYDVVLVTLPAERGLGLAIADRLRKAAASR